MSNLGNKETMAYNLRRLLEPSGMNIKDFAKLLNFKYTTVLDWFNANSYPRIDKIEIMAAFFGVSKSDLVEEYDPAKETFTKNKQKLNDTFDKLNAPHQKKVLNYAQHELKVQQATDNKIMELAEYRTDKEYDYYDHAASAGTGQYLASMEKERITLPVDYDADFVIPIYGNSMEPDYYSGDYVFIEQTFNLNDGDIGVFDLNGTAYIKELNIDGNKIYLHSLNPEYKDIKITPDCDFRIIGKVVGRYNEK